MDDYNKHLSMTEAMFEEMVSRDQETAPEFFSINTQTNKNKFKEVVELSEYAGEIETLANKSADELGQSIRFAAFSDQPKPDYDYYSLNQYYREFPNVDRPLPGEHGFSRIPSGQNRGLLLKRDNHPTRNLAFISDFYLRSPIPRSLPETYNLSDYSTDQLKAFERELDGTPDPHRFYTADFNNEKRTYSFPKNERVSSRFTRMEPNEVSKIILSAYPIDEIKEYIRQHETPNNIPGKKGHKYYVYGDAGRRSIQTLGIGHAMDARVRSTILSTKKKFAKINPSLDFDAVMEGRQGLTHNEIQQLFDLDVKEKIQTAQRLFPLLHTYPKQMQMAIVDGYFWGMLAKSRKTRIYLKDGKYEQAKKEWLDNTTYRGIAHRPDGTTTQRFLKFNKAIESMEE